LETKRKAESLLTGRLITEAIDKPACVLCSHVISTILFDKPAFTGIVTGFIMAADGQKLSKRLKNYRQ